MSDARQAEIKPLTGLRGVAACWVMLYHFVPDVAGSGAAGNVLKHGYLAVDLFFVLSGFVMAMTYAADFRSGFSHDVYGRFLLKRLGRVYPLYFVSVLACAALHYAGGQPLSGATLGANLLLVQAWGLADSINGPGWSISTELAAYLLFPALCALTLFGRRGVAWAGAAAGAAILVGLAALPDAVVGAVPPVGRNGPLDIYMPGTPWLVLRCLAGFVLGLLAFRIAAVPAAQRLAAREWFGTGAATVTLLALSVQNTDVALTVLFVPLLVALAVGRSPAARLLECRPVYWLGMVSYSIYLVHWPVIEGLRSPLMRVLEPWRIPHTYSVAGALLVPVTLAAAAATFHLVERPGRELSRRLARRRLPVSA